MSNYVEYFQIVYLISLVIAGFSMTVLQEQIVFNIALKRAEKDATPISRRVILGAIYIEPFVPLFNTFFATICVIAFLVTLGKKTKQ